VLIVAAIGVTVYILEHQPSFTLGQSTTPSGAQFATAAAVTAGQGQAVDVAGVQVGEVGGVPWQVGARW
jgi:ABC-type transporter Mla subunit MlaD